MKIILIVIVTLIMVSTAPTTSAASIPNESALIPNDSVQQSPQQQDGGNHSYVCFTKIKSDTKIICLLNKCKNVVMTRIVYECKAV